MPSSPSSGSYLGKTMRILRWNSSSLVRWKCVFLERKRNPRKKGPYLRV